ncbi:hypothetical protein AVEN_206672-1 [Araneus ventricosus]|uniref:ribonuclease H n=1 Tax=Araneus ventricosus TaxID=182803 RepID=A0A4Y2MRH2_ARAVE|nr:hypothetical protein AVEN_206672-1 [Araneus ventricosus]
MSSLENAGGVLQTAQLITNGKATEEEGAFPFAYSCNYRLLALLASTSELLAIREALNFALHFENSDIYVLTDSKSSIQYLKNWPEIREKTGQEVVSKIATLSQKSRVCFQWIPSHVGVFGNEEADVLAKEGSALPSASSRELFTSEIYSIHKAIANSAWRNPPTHDWYARNRPGLSLQSVGTRSAQTRLIGQVA